MIGFVVTNPEVLIARRLERGGRSAPGLDFIRWRLAQIRAEVADDAEFWGIPLRDICLTRAAQIAEARTGDHATQVLNRDIQQGQRCLNPSPHRVSFPTAVGSVK